MYQKKARNEGGGEHLVKIDSRFVGSFFAKAKCGLVSTGLDSFDEHSDMTGTYGLGFLSTSLSFQSMPHLSFCRRSRTHSPKAGKKANVVRNC